MIEYRVIERFADLQDDNRIYNVGDRFPHEGFTVTAERLEELSGSRNKAGRPFIEEISIKEAEAPKTEPEKPSQAKEEKPKKAPSKKPIRKAKKC